MESIVCNGVLKVRVAGQYGPLRWLCNALQTAAVLLLLVDTYILVKSRGWYFRVENVWLVRWKRNILLPLVLDKILILILNIILTLSPPGIWYEEPGIAGHFGNWTQNWLGCSQINFRPRRRHLLKNEIPHILNLWLILYHFKISWVIEKFEVAKLQNIWLSQHLFV